MARKVTLVRGGVLSANTGIGGAHHALARALEGEQVDDWRLQGVAEYDLGPHPNLLSRVMQRWFTHPRKVRSLATSEHRPDLIHITDQEQAHLVPKSCKVPVVVTVHDLFHLFPKHLRVGATNVEIGQLKPPLMRRRDIAQLKRGLARSDLLLCDSYATLEACKIHFPNVDSLWLPLGLNMDAFSPKEGDERVPIGPASEFQKGCHLLIVGSHDPRKRMSFLMEVLGGLEDSIKLDLHIHHVGTSISSSKEASINHLAEQHGVMNFTAHGGDLSSEALMNLRHASEVLLFPSVSEGFGYPPIEAMATGTPVLCADMPSHNELMPPGSCLSADETSEWQKRIAEVHSAWKDRSVSDSHHVWPEPDQTLIEHARTFDIGAFCQRTSDAYNRFF
ncbi:MAG: glycosyltransferase [Euryarchaeota archaeon]